MSYGMAPKLDGRRCPWKKLVGQRRDDSQQGEEQPALPEKTRSFGVCHRMQHMFYQSVMASVFFFLMTCCLQPQQTGEEGGVLLAGCERLDTILKNSSHLEINVYRSKRGNYRFIYPGGGRERLGKSVVLTFYNETTVVW